jgi:hypothetical protein
LCGTVHAIRCPCTGYLEYMFSNVTFCASLGTPIGYGGYINQPLQAHLGPVSVILRSREAFSSRSEVYPSSSVGISAISPRHEAASTSGFETPQAETFGNGQESTSHAVHRRWVLPAAIAGVRCRYRCARRLPSRARGCTSATRSEAWGRDIRDSKCATTRERPAGVESVGTWPRFDEPRRLFHGGPSD